MPLRFGARFRGTDSWGNPALWRKGRAVWWVQSNGRELNKRKREPVIRHDSTTEDEDTTWDQDTTEGEDEKRGTKAKEESVKVREPISPATATSLKWMVMYTLFSFVLCTVDRSIYDQVIQNYIQPWSSSIPSSIPSSGVGQSSVSESSPQAPPERHFGNNLILVQPSRYLFYSQTLIW